MEINFKQSQGIMTSLMYHIGCDDNKFKDGIQPWSGYVGLYAKNRSPVGQHTLLQMIRVFPNAKRASSIKASKSKMTVVAVGAKISNSLTMKGIFVDEKQIIVTSDRYIIVLINDDVFAANALKSLTFRIALLVWEFDLIRLNLHQNNADIVRNFFKEMNITDTGVIRLFHDALKSWKSKTQKYIPNLDVNLL